MKNILLYIIAIPVGLIASIIIPSLLEYIIIYFIPFETLVIFLQLWFLKLVAGSLTTVIPTLIVPNRKKLFFYATLALALFATICEYKRSGDFNYLYLMGALMGIGLLAKK